MHYFQFNIGDYASHTSRLAPLEDLAYRRMLDLYYLNEQPLNECVKEVAREIGLSDYADEVEYILCKFFTKNENGFSQKRIDLEIKKYKSNAKNKSRAGKASAKARAVKASSKVTGVEQVLNTTSTDVEQNTKHKPLTINQETVSNKDIVVSTPAFNFKNELLLLGVDKEILNDWMKVRTKKRATNTQSALTLLVSQIGKAGLTIDQGIRFANDENWGAFKLDWYKNKQGVNHGHKSTGIKESSHERIKRENDIKYRNQRPDQSGLVMGETNGDMGRIVGEGEWKPAIGGLDKGDFVDY
ncbi:MAG: YdaU family protein [Pseudoalteromonas sp.]|uniref:YdaU family protein n=1 Tax=Pseudoalteromonas sp. TaxID=53249 RepID=UPI001D9CD3BF|nr:DUF1376 domain-containing protein [Pseudoalteromonas sp.]NRA76726.1 YdaU family protein [Pseudoalteromonas sp.]